MPIVAGIARATPQTFRVQNEKFAGLKAFNASRPRAAVDQRKFAKVLAHPYG